MLINNKNISTFSATLIDRRFTNHEVVSVNDWLDGSPSPIFLREYTRYKRIGLDFIFEGTTEQIILSNIDRMVGEIKRSTIKFDDLTFLYDVHMEGTIMMEKANNTTYKVVIELRAHRTYKPEIGKVANKTLSTTLINTGTKETAVWIEIKPTITLPSFTISGLSSKPIVLTNLVKDATYIIDSYTFRYLRNGANEIANFNGFEFAKAAVGTNNIAFSAASADITLKYFPNHN